MKRYRRPVTLTVGVCLPSWAWCLVAALGGVTATCAAYGAGELFYGVLRSAGLVP